MKTKDLSFKETKPSASGKTRNWDVIGTAGDDDVIGRISWWPAWRKYVYVIGGLPSILLAPNCLREIADFCEEATRAHTPGWIELELDDPHSWQAGDEFTFNRGGMEPSVGVAHEDDWGQLLVGAWYVRRVAPPDEMATCEVLRVRRKIVDPNSFEAIAQAVAAANPPTPRAKPAGAIG